MSKRTDFISSIRGEVNKGSGKKGVDNLASDELGYDLKLEEAVSTGIPILDFYLGGGLYTGRVYEIFGEESHGKSTLSYHFMSRLEQDWSGITILAESETALDKDRAHLIGADPDNIITFTPDHVEDCFKMISKYLKGIRESQAKLKKKDPNKNVPTGIFWDTIASAPTSTEVEHAEGDGDKWGGGQAEKPRLIREWLRSVTKVLPKSNAFIVLVNQVYEKTDGYGKQLVSPGGRGIRHHTSARIFVKKGTSIISEDSRTVGFTVEVRMVKCKQAPTQDKTFKVDLYYSTGYDPLSSITHYIVDHKLVDVSGNGWITLHIGDEEVKAHGVQKLTQKMKEDKRIYNALLYKAAMDIAGQSPVIRRRFYDRLCELAEQTGSHPPLHEKWDVYAREFKLHMSKNLKQFVTIEECLDFVLSHKKKIEKKDFTTTQRNKFLEEKFTSSK